MILEKVKVVEALRDRGLDERAGWVSRQLPDIIDAKTNAGLLSTLGIDIAALSSEAEGSVVELTHGER
jgi:hypothetical protein